MQDRATWVGVAIRLASGDIIAYQLNDPNVHLELSHEFDRAMFLGAGFRAPHAVTRLRFEVEGAVADGNWTTGADEARRSAPGALPAQEPKAIGQ